MPQFYAMSMVPQAQQQSLPLADSDVEIVRRWVLEIAVGWLLYGITTTLFIITGYLVLTKHLQRSRAQFALFGLIMLMLMISTVSIFLNTAFILNDILTAGFTPPDNLQRLKDILISQVLIGRTNYLLSDGIVVWRAWVMFPDGTLIKTILTLATIGSCVGVYTDAGMTAVLELHDINDQGQKIRILIMAIPLLATNVFAISLIGYKAWMHQRDIKKNLNLCGNSVSKVQKVLLLLVESGIIYCILWITFILVAFVSSANSVAGQIYPLIMPFLATLYPIFVILMVTLEKSRDEFKSVNDMKLSQSIRFAAVQAAASHTSDDTNAHWHAGGVSHP
ncbi:hypothetical protein D9758_006990 [Tetrapyrgos nigripes]|uniref:Uncharacterized protein n=1 Tax=Tetrapyrgos nigripes TaxID=182062 RepID=A0A8H5GSR3_9AGAR|nr:hypothetical protein D9758_006990 [Tetrapyrgos nigripes]